MRLDNPTTLDLAQLLPSIQSGTIQLPLIIQFSNSAAYQPATLKGVNELCQFFGDSITVRFYAHYNESFDCRILHHLPAVRALHLDSLTHANNLDALNHLPRLDAFSFGVYDAVTPRLLETSPLTAVRELSLGETRSNSIELDPLSSFTRLEYLTLNGHARGIHVLGSLTEVRRLNSSASEKKSSYTSSAHSINCDL